MYTKNYSFCKARTSQNLLQAIIVYTYIIINHAVKFVNTGMYQKYCVIVGLRYCNFYEKISLFYIEIRVFLWYNNMDIFIAHNCCRRIRKR